MDVLQQFSNLSVHQMLGFPHGMNGWAPPIPRVSDTAGLDESGNLHL